jgi:pimeloyl-ACP methyl ester carboxylesterase
LLKSISYRPGHSLAYADFGSPTGDHPILIQHGMIASIRDQHLFHRLAASGARLISMARPGYGLSSPYALRSIAEWGEIVAALVEELGLNHFDVLGISSGAPYSYALGYAFPERVRRLYILSGTPALYDEDVRAAWPYPLPATASNEADNNAGLTGMQDLAQALFFAHLPQPDLERADVQDSMRNNAFGVALDLAIRGRDWGFRLADVKAKVLMRHSRADTAVPLVTAERTARLLPDCRLEIHENDPHFSQEVLDDFIDSITH